MPRDAPRTARAPGQIREGLAHVRQTPSLLTPLLMMALIGCLAYEFQVVLPLVARDAFGGSLPDGIRGPLKRVQQTMRRS